MMEIIIALILKGGCLKEIIRYIGNRKIYPLIPIHVKA